MATQIKYRKNLSQNIIAHLQSKGLTQKAIGRLIDLSPSSVSRIKRGERNFTMSHLKRLEKEFQVPLPVILAGAIDSFTELPEWMREEIIPLFELLGADQQPPRHLIEVADFITIELIKYLKNHPKTLYSIKPRQFEELVTEILASHGWQVQLTPAVKDGGYDIFAISKDVQENKESWIIECKKYAPENKIGVNIVRALYGVKHLVGATNAMLATTSFFTIGARKLKTSCYNMELKDYYDMVEWINEYKPNPSGKLYIRERNLILPEL